MHHAPDAYQYRETEQADSKLAAGSNAALPHGEEREVPFVFSGNGREYFRIWIVNILLTILTLGIYSAWAKVRNKQYFYGSTTLDGASFTYTASPQKILVGRIIAATLLGLYVLAESLSVTAALVMMLVFVIALPWIVCQSLRFNARYSRYRNVSFEFSGTAWEAARAFVFWPIAGALTLGLLMPLAIHRQQQFMVGRHHFGDSQFAFHARPGAYYKLYLAAGVTFVFGFLLVSLFSFVFSVLPESVGVWGSMLLFLMVYLSIISGVTAAMANLRYCNTTIERHRFHANWDIFSYVGIFLSNMFLTVVTLGLFYPWGKVRMARYKAEHTRVFAHGDLGTFAEQQREQAGPVAEGVSDLFDFDIGL